MKNARRRATPSDEGSRERARMAVAAMLPFPGCFLPGGLMKNDERVENDVEISIKEGNISVITRDNGIDMRFPFDT